MIFDFEFEQFSLAELKTYRLETKMLYGQLAKYLSIPMVFKVFDPDLSFLCLV